MSWQTDETDKDHLAWRTVASASDVTPFLVNCCLEIKESDESTRSNHREGFPFKAAPNLPTIRLKRIINLKINNLHKIKYLLENKMVSFSVGKWLKLFYISGNKENIGINCLMDHISQNLEDVMTLFQLVNVKCDIKCKSPASLVSYSCAMYMYTGSSGYTT